MVLLKKLGDQFGFVARGSVVHKHAAWLVYVKKVVHMVLKYIQVVLSTHGSTLRLKKQITCTIFSTKNAPNHHRGGMFDGLGSIAGVVSVATLGASYTSGTHSNAPEGAFIRKADLHPLLRGPVLILISKH